MSVFFTSVTLILYIKNTISMLGWKLRPLPAYTVPRHIHWQGINLKFGMLIRPKCWQLIQIWCTHTQAPSWQQNGASVVQHGLTMYTEQSEAQGTADSVWPHANEWTFGEGKHRNVRCGNMASSTMWIMVPNLKAWSNIYTCTRNTNTLCWKY